MDIEIEISSRIKELITQNNRQVHSLDLLGQDLKDSYNTGAKKAILVFHSQVFKKQAHLITAKDIAIMDNELSPHLKIGDMIVVILPTDTKNRFVFQTRVENIFVDRFKLSILDPRFDERQKLTSTQEMRFWRVPYFMVEKMQIKELSLIRKVEGIPVTLRPAGADAKKQRAKGRHAPAAVIDESTFDATSAKQIVTPDASAAKALKAPASGPQVCTIVEILCEKSKQEADDYKNMLADQAFPGVIEDISLGGLYIKVRKEAVKFHLNEFFYLDIAGEKAGKKMRIKVFAVVRECRPVEKNYELHLMFISRLPERAAGYFNSLG